MIAVKRCGRGQLLPRQFSKAKVALAETYVLLGLLGTENAHEQVTVAFSRTAERVENGLERGRGRGLVRQHRKVAPPAAQ